MHESSQTENKIYQHPEYIGDRKEMDDGSKTLLEMFCNTAQLNENCDLLGTIDSETEKIEYETFGDVYEKIVSLGNALREEKKLLGAKEFNNTNSNDDDEKNDDKNNEKDIIKKSFDKEIIGIFSVNRAEWIISEYAIYHSNSTNCPLYSTFGAEALKHILTETEMRICFVSGTKAEDLYKSVICETSYSLETIISYDKLSEELERKYNSQGIKVLYISDLYDCNEFTDKTLDYPIAEDIATICYTSGTSGNPKGVLLSHLNFISAIIGFDTASGDNCIIHITNNDVYISYLPLAHVMERICVLMMIAKCAKIVFFRGNPKNLQKDIALIKPTVFVGVPRVFNVFKEKIEEAINGKSLLLRWIIKAAISYKIKQQEKGIYTNYVLDSLIFNKVKNVFGGKIRASLNGSAPLSKSVTEYLQAVLSSKIFQGYGQTEGTAANIIMTANDYDNDGVGIPFPSNMVKLVPTEEYSGTKGEICLKGNNITKGYYKRPDLNNETFQDGWLFTGDIGSYENGKFKIIGRRKEIFKTSLGEYIVPEKIEGLLKTNHIEDIYITGKTHGDFIIAIVVCKNEKICKADLLKEITTAGDKAFKLGKLTRFEIPKEIIVLRKDFSDYGELLTPTSKKMRSKVDLCFKNEIYSLYEK
ncbi:Long-chain-fatty-acid--CoA ligase 6 [Conglomerata obtusa]